MAARFVVSGTCARPCASCAGCRPITPPDPDELDARAGDGRVDLGGGDALEWSGLARFLQLSTARPGRVVYVEAPARSFDAAALARLRAAGAAGVVIQLDGAHEEPVAHEARALGLDVRLRLAARSATLMELIRVAIRLRPAEAVLELAERDRFVPAELEAALSDAPNVSFSSARQEHRGYLPACVLPRLWRIRPHAFRGTLRAAAAEPNDALPACARCALAPRCRWRASEPCPPAVLASASPIASTADLFPQPRPVRRSEPPSPVRCTTPWTTMEITQPDGIVRQCCTTWTVGSRGDAIRSGLAGVWNGEGYRAARRLMAADDGEGLCEAICPRRHDRRFDERHFTIEPGSDRFVQNQKLVADDIRERREVARGMPLHLALCPSTYCNFDCVMCVHGRTPRRDLPDHVFDELPELLPFLRALTLLGGEPFAHPRTWEILERADRAHYPDLHIDVVTNASLLTSAALRRIEGAALGHVTVSLNAGTAETYARIQRGIAFDEVLANLDALLDFRARQPRWFGVTLSFVVQPGNCDDLLAFARLADQRNLDVRLLPLSARGIPELDFFADPVAVARVAERLEQLAAHARSTRPEWLREIDAVRAATLAEAAGRLTALRVRRLG